MSPNDNNDPQTQPSSSALRQGGARNSALVQDGDPGSEANSYMWAEGAAEETYAYHSFAPAAQPATNIPTEIDTPNNTPDEQAAALKNLNLTYTPARVAKDVFNVYDDSTDNCSVFCYFTDWAQYDDRHGNFPGDNGLAETVPPPGYGDGRPEDDPDFYAMGGRSANVMRLADSPYEKIVIGFAGIIGDRGEKSAIIQQGAIDFKLIPASGDISGHEGEVTFVDSWGDVLAYLNCGFDRWVSNDAAGMFDQNKAQGVLGGLAKLYKDHGKTIALSIGGWSMSEPFSRVCADETMRGRFVSSLNRIFTAFPMITYLDLDWEYPGSAGAGNSFDPVNDGPNFAKLISEIKTTYQHLNDSKGIGISIAISADIAKIEVANIPALVAAGVDGINLMSYDFFTVNGIRGGNLSHHTNLHHAVDDYYSRYSIKTAVDYLLTLDGVTSTMIFVGYAGYSRSTHKVSLNQVSPLVGTYKPFDTQPITVDGQAQDVMISTVGSFESNVSEWPDIIYNYLDLESQTGLNGFELYTDTVADADFLYNPTSQVFMSIDTPRSVKAKAEYVKDRNLGGLFIWSGDQDGGLLANAACEGLGRTATTQNIDMSDFYFQGATEGGDGNIPPIPVEDKPREPECVECQEK